MINLIKSMKSEKGFTLIEMLLVIIIISFLIGIVLTGTGGFQASARDTRRIGDLRNAQNFLELYFNKCGHYPGVSDSKAECSATVSDWTSLGTVMSNANITKQFPKEISGKRYYYGVNTSGGLDYVIGAQLERDNSVLKDSLDTTKYNVLCSRSQLVYCISSD